MFKPENTLILIGNGINCAAVDDDSFNLKTGMEYSWEQIQQNKDLVELIKDITGKSKPETEEQLKAIQENILAINSIKQAQAKLHPTLRGDFENAEIFKNDYSKYLLDVAKYFYNKSLDLQNNNKYKAFLNNLATFIKENHSQNSRTNIATLNYDAGLYQGLLALGIMKEYYDTTCLVDGFWSQKKGGFKDSNLVRKESNTNNFGWYLHLHGSPIFYSDKDNIHKAKLEEVDKFTAEHLILCSPSQKYETIMYSELLSEYLHYFKQAVVEAKNIIVIGYGGDDLHINDIISNFVQDNAKIIIIVGSKQGEALRYWQQWQPKFAVKNLYNELENVLDINFKEVMAKYQQ